MGFWYRQILSFELQLCRKTAKEGKREVYFEFLVERQILSYELQLCRKTVKEGKREAWAGFLVEANLVY